MSPSDFPDHPGSIFYHSKSSEVPIFHKSVTGQELFFAVSYSKPALPYLKKSINFFTIVQISTHKRSSVTDLTLVFLFGCLFVGLVWTPSENNE